MSSQAGPRRRGIVVPIIFILAVVAGLVALGTWQLERKSWKEGLIAELEEKLSAPPVALPPRERWPQLSAEKDEFRRVTFPTEFVRDEEVLVFSSGSSLRPDAKGPGYWVFSPARTADGGLIVINRGFVPEGRQDPETRTEGKPSGVVEVIGYIRWMEPRGVFTPKDNPPQHVWYVRDPAGMAAGMKWGPVAPFYIDQEAPPVPGGLPKVGPLKPSLPNNHLQYAVTWYGLALVVLISGILFLRARRREVAMEAIDST
ncbi:MAG: SURF1 family protein [Xanthobacteraceae bacterium]